MTGPSTVSFSSGSPTFNDPAAACNPATSLSYTPRCASTRVGAVQIWPEWNAHTLTIVEIAVRRSASSNTTRSALAAELEQQSLHVVSRDLTDALTDCGRTGEAHHVHVLRRDERLTDLSAGSGDDVDDSGREARLLHELAHAR